MNQRAKDNLVLTHKWSTLLIVIKKEPQWENYVIKKISPVLCSESKNSHYVIRVMCSSLYPHLIRHQTIAESWESFSCFLSEYFKCICISHLLFFLSSQQQQQQRGILFSSRSRSCWEKNVELSRFVKRFV